MYVAASAGRSADTLMYMMARLLRRPAGVYFFLVRLTASLFALRRCCDAAPAALSRGCQCLQEGPGPRGGREAEQRLPRQEGKLYVFIVLPGLGRSSTANVLKEEGEAWSLASYSCVEGCFWWLSREMARFTRTGASSYHADGLPTWITAAAVLLVCLATFWFLGATTRVYTPASIVWAQMQPSDVPEVEQGAHTLLEDRCAPRSVSSHVDMRGGTREFELPSHPSASAEQLVERLLPRIPAARSPRRAPPLQRTSSRRPRWALPTLSSMPALSPGSLPIAQSCYHGPPPAACARRETARACGVSCTSCFRGSQSGCSPSAVASPAARGRWMVRPTCRASSPGSKKPSRTPTTSCAAPVLAAARRPSSPSVLNTSPTR